MDLWRVLIATNKKMKYISIFVMVLLLLNSCGNRGNSHSKEEAMSYLKGMMASKDLRSDKKICALAAGQSNIDGRVDYAQMPESIKNAQPLRGTYYVKNSVEGAFAPINITGKWAFDLVTYYHIAKVTQDDLYVIKWTEGGTSIDPLGDSDHHWTVDWERIGGGNSLLKQFEREILAHIESNGDDFEIKALLWHQGEGDRGDIGKGCDERYYVNLRNMIAYIRGMVGNVNLPVITGTISHHSKQYDKTIEGAQKRLAAEDPYFYLIDMSGATLMDNFHFDAESSIYFGEMCFDKLIEAGVIQSNKINPRRPW